jgi:hypothetical protein
MGDVYVVLATHQQATRGGVMGIKRIVAITVLQGEEQLLIDKYARTMANGYQVFLDGVRMGSFQIDQGDLAVMHSSSELRKWYDTFERAEPLKLQDAVNIPLGKK